MKPEVYDCFTFFANYELDLLEIRLNILDEHVDKFVIVEAGEVHSGKKKRPIRPHELERFSQFKDKIIYEFIETFPTGLSTFERHKYQVNYAHKITNTLDKDTLIISGDIDEIPDPLLLTENLKLADEGKLIVFEQKMCYYYLNMQTEDLHSAAGETENWLGTRICKNKYLLGKVTIDDLRLPMATRYGLIVKHGGWHFSHQGGLEGVLKKIESSAHQEFNNDFIKENIINSMNEGKDLYLRNARFKVVSLEKYPQYILNNLDQYKHMIRESDDR